MKYSHLNKKQNISNMVKYSLAKTRSMFEYSGLPETLKARDLENILQNNGVGFFTKHNGKYYLFKGSKGGELNAYDEPTKFNVSNTFLKLTKQYDIDNDGILFRNDDEEIGLIPLLEKAHSLLNENELTMWVNNINSRMTALITAPDGTTKQSAESYIQKISDGELSVIGENIIFDGVKIHSNNSTSANTTSQLIELHQYIKGSLENELGLNSAYNMKKERLITSEVEQGEDATYPLILNMLKCRVEAIEQINVKYGLEINVKFGGVWAIKNDAIIQSSELTVDGQGNQLDLLTTLETSEMSNAIDDLIKLGETFNEPTDEPTDEPTQKPTDEPTDEPTQKPTEEPPKTGEKVAEVIEDVIMDSLNELVEV